ncbi:Major facilitator superfamily domain containing protein [Naviculisporaceae sp. PSN 640]
MDDPISPTTVPVWYQSPAPAARSATTLVVLAKLAAFTDALLSGLLIPLVPSIIRDQTSVHDEQVQIWTSVFIAAYGGAFVAASPFLPLFWHKRSSIWTSLTSGLVLAATSFALLQTSTGITTLVLARALQGFSGVLITGASAGLMSISARISRDAAPLSWISTPFIQGIAMIVGPAAGGLLYDRFGGLPRVFCYAYAALALTALITLVGFKLYGKGAGAGSRHEQRSLLGSNGGNQSSYGTIDAESESEATPESTATPSPTGSIMALGGSIMVTLLLAALQSVLPIWAGRTFHWPVSKIGFLFVHLFVPATVVGLTTGLITNRAPRSARFLATLGFLICAPAFWYLGNLPEHKSAAETALMGTLSVLSIGIGFCTGPLFGSTATVSRASLSTRERARVAVQITSIPNIASAWGILIGPLVAGAVGAGWGWEALTQLLATLSATSAVLIFFFLNGWIGSRNTSRGNSRSLTGDEESGPLLSTTVAHSRAIAPKGNPDKAGLGAGGYSSERTVTSDDYASITNLKKKHTRHFSADNFSIASTTANGETTEISQVRIRASLESPVVGNFNPDAAQSRRSSRGSSVNTERRFRMREAPHAPTTDPLLAAGNRYVIDESAGEQEGSAAPAKKRHVVVFPEEECSPELLAKRKHHIVAINSLDGSIKLAKPSGFTPGNDALSMRIDEEIAPDAQDEDRDGEAVSPMSQGAAPKEEVRRYVVIVLNEGETGIDPVTGGASE